MYRDYYNMLRSFFVQINRFTPLASVTLSRATSRYVNEILKCKYSKKVFK